MSSSNTATEANHIRQTIEGELQAFKNNDNITCDNLLKIVKDGMKEYEKEFNKPMSYAEMRTAKSRIIVHDEGV